MVNECLHERKQLCRRLLANETWANYYQCQECGRAVGSAVSKSEAERIHPGLLPVFDDERRKTQEQQRVQAWRDQQAQRHQEQEMSQALWWDVYRAYLDSAAWQAKRQAVLRRDEWICQGCLERPACDVHHLTYKHLEYEFLFELVSVCRACHDRWHSFVEEQERPWVV